MKLQHSHKPDNGNGRRPALPDVQTEPIVWKRQRAIDGELLKAATAGNRGKIMELVESGARLETMEARFRWTPLICASVEGKVDAVKTLLSAAKKKYSDDKESFRAYINQTDATGWNAVMWASAEKHSEVVTLLRRCGGAGALIGHSIDSFYRECSMLRGE